MIRTTKRTFSPRRTALILVTALVLPGAAEVFGQTIPPPGPESVNKLIAVLKSDAPQHEKAEACRQLGGVGTREAVPVLAALLADEKLAHMARYALEPIPDPAVDDALREALGKLKGRPLVGAIGSLGVRRDAKAVEPLARLLADPDADVAQAVARSLGRIGTAEAAKALRGALAGASGANQLAVCEGLFRAAESLAAQGQGGEAVAIYDHLRGLEQSPHQVRSGAVRGAILARGKEGLPLLGQALRGKDYVSFAAAVRAAQEMSGNGVTEALTAALGQLPADRQIVVIQALGNRGDSAALPALWALAKSGTKPVRLAAIRTAPQFESAGADLFQWIDDPDPEIAEAARESLAGLRSRQPDGLLMKMLADGQAKERLAALELIGRRRVPKAAPALLKAAEDPDANIRRAALRTLGEVGTVADWSALLELLTRSKDSQDLDAAEQALSAVWAKADSPDSLVEKLPGAMAGAAAVQPAQQGALVRVLGKVGGAAALKAVRAAVKEPNAEVRATAIRTLAAWKTADVVPDLLALARSASAPTDKRLALRGYLTWAANAELPADQRLSMCREAARLIQTAEEKKRLLAALGGIASPESLALIVPYLDEADTRDEAGTAALSVAENLLKGRDAAQVAPNLIEPLKKVSQAADADLARRAKAALERAQQKPRRK